MNKTKAQEKAIKEKYEEGEINKSKHSRYDTEGGKEHKESDGYRTKKNKDEKEGKREDGSRVKKHKCSDCGKMY